ncbi:energy transducer TonB [Saccharophagus sp. K07]|jgi:protein TonB|uniref:energy transducer TonB n=1 Tax=Saccharophagus sp. K07 TaxID=2283636 RepID=UPI0016525ADE|nr:energy transducer TonB [Saccharophagus sp. K07]MBC6906460.1 energy transducer TonB [Saccharophagus sp. K07]
MSIARYFTAGGFALGVTLGLLLLMHVLIQTNIKAPGEVVEFKVPDIVMPERQIETKYDVSKPQKPEEVEVAPPDLPEPTFDTPDASNEGISIDTKFDSKPTITGPAGFGDGEMIPLTVVQPEYPRRAAQRGTEGYCTVEFTVSANGTTKDAFIADCSDSVFQNAALKAAEKIKYKPRVVDGQPVDVPGVQYKFLFQMAKE